MSTPRRSRVWHPFTQHAIQPEATMIASGEREWLVTPDGRRILDGISSWWVVTHGHRHPKIVAAIKDQIDKLDQVIFAGYTHEPAEKLAEALVLLSPKGLDHVFFSDSGSTAVEVAIKMALGTFHNRGEKRHRILALEHGYHGDTIGAMSAGARGVFSTPYAPLLFEVTRIPFPHAGREQETIDAIAAACQAGDVAALLVEPLILGAGGMLTYGAATLAEMALAARTHGTLVIADEVMTGWGRTGTLFACSQAGLAPDLMCIAKGLTGGSLPLAATLATAAIFDAHYSPDRARTFFHSSSYTANPVACAAALANCDVWRTEPVLDRIANLARAQGRHAAAFQGDADFTGVRQLGTITALDIAAGDAGYLADVGPKLYAFFQSRDLLLRPLGNTIYVMPPYCIDDTGLDRIYAAIHEAADACL